LANNAQISSPLRTKIPNKISFPSSHFLLALSSRILTQSDRPGDYDPPSNRQLLHYGAETPFLVQHIQVRVRVFEGIGVLWI
jgi:hypothetical protein